MDSTNFHTKISFTIPISQSASQVTQLKTCGSGNIRNRRLPRTWSATRSPASRWYCRLTRRISRRRCARFDKTAVTLSPPLETSLFSLFGLASGFEVSSRGVRQIDGISLTLTPLEGSDIRFWARTSVHSLLCTIATTHHQILIVYLAAYQLVRFWRSDSWYEILED